MQQLGFVSDGKERKAVHDLHGTTEAEAAAEAADPIGDEVEARCAPPRVWIRVGKKKVKRCVDTPRRQPRAWGLPSWRRYRRASPRYRRRYRRRQMRAYKRYAVALRKQLKYRYHPRTCTSPMVKRGKRCVHSPLRSRRAWGLPRKPLSKYTRAEWRRLRSANRAYTRGLRGSHKQNRGKYRVGIHSLIPQRFPHRDGASLGDNVISNSNAWWEPPDATDSFNDRMIKRDKHLRSRTPQFLRAFTGRHDHDLTHPYWTRKNLRKLYKPQIRRAIRSKIMPSLGKYVPARRYQRQFHPREVLQRHALRRDRFRPLSRFPNYGRPTRAQVKKSFPGDPCAEGAGVGGCRETKKQAAQSPLTTAAGLGHVNGEPNWE
jgi:hypothetical protein